MGAGENKETVRAEVSMSLQNMGNNWRLFNSAIANQGRGMGVTDGVREWMIKSITPPKMKRRDGIQYWQDRIIFTLLMIGVFFGLVVYIPSVVLAIREKLWAVTVADTVIYCWVIVLFFKRSLPFQIRAASLVVLSYLLGMVLILSVGPYGAGPVWLFFFPIITGLFFNLRWTLAALTINILTIVSLAWLIYLDVFRWAYAEGFPTEAWIIVGLNFILLDILAAISIVLVINGLQHSLELEKSMLVSLEQKNIEMRDTNFNLLRVIQEREKVERALKRSERALEESEIRFQDLVSLLPLSYFLMDYHFTLKYINRNTYEMFGISSLEKEDGCLRKMTDLLAPKDRLMFEQTINDVIADQKPGWYRFVGRTSNGTEIPLEILASKVGFGDKAAVIQGIIVDISDRLEMESIKQAKEIAEETSKAISDWVSFIAHELRTPISGLLHFSQIGLRKLNDGQSKEHLLRLRQKLESFSTNQTIGKPPILEQFDQTATLIAKREERFSKSFDRIHLAGDRLSRLLNELLDLSKLESGKMEFNMQKADLIEIIQEAVNELEAILEAKALKLEIEPTTLPTEIVGDAFRLGQVVRNLLHNAVKFSQSGTTIVISFKQTRVLQGRRQNDEEVAALQTTIRDQGVGIPADQIELIFNKFKQSRKTKTGEGSGLGLPICKEIVLAHSGKIWAESQEEQGTEMHFVLPYQNARAS